MKMREDTKIALKRIGASLTLYLSIWLGLIIMGIALYPEHWMDVWNNLQIIFSNPITGIVTVIKNAFQNGSMQWLLGIFIGTIVVGGIASVFTGGGFNSLFTIPLILGFSIVIMFMLPTSIILTQTDFPFMGKVIVTLILGGLTLITIISFTSGRN